jgi:hypothetical protein
MPTGFFPVHFADNLEELAYKRLQLKNSFNKFELQFLTCYGKNFQF